jgi:adenosylhomocysteine nucleosidase
MTSSELEVKDGGRALRHAALARGMLCAMSDPRSVRRVGMLVPMQIELDPVVRLLGLTDEGDRWTGRTGDVEVVARLTTIGMGPARRAAERILEDDVDWVFVVGIAGGVAPGIEIGSVIAPATVVERASGRAVRPAALGDGPVHGILSCGDDLIVDPAVLDGMAAEGVIAVDMETAAVGAVCEDAGRPWSAFRGISDHAGAGLIDPGIFAMTLPDGRADPDAMARWLDGDPGRRAVLAQLAHDTNLATEAAAAAAVAALELVRRPG